MATTFKKKSGQASDVESKAVVVTKSETSTITSELTLEQLELDKKMCEDSLTAVQDRIKILEEEIVKVKALVE